MKHLPPGWKEEKDGSLKDKGKEFTLPVWHTHAEEYLIALFDALHKPRASSRCSVHVHADVTTFELDQIKTLILLYTVFERPLFHYSGNRWNNIYCVPVQDWALGINIDEMDYMTIAQTFPKYSAMNVFPDGGKLGTVEFRHMAGNKNPMYIKTWIEILVSLVKYAKQKDYKELKTDLMEMRHSSQYWDLFKDIFKEHVAALNYSNFDQQVEQGITIAKLMTND